MPKKHLILTIFCAILTTLLSCTTYVQARTTLTELIQQLQDPTLEVREEALKKLEELGDEGLPVEEGILALNAAASTFPPLKYEWKSISEALIRATWQKPDKQYIPVVRACYDKYNTPAREAALNLLTRIEDREAAVTVMEILKKHSITGDPLYINLTYLTEHPRYLEVYFPAILDYITVLDWEWEIYAFFLHCLEYGLLTPGEIASKESLLISRYSELKTAVRTYEKGNDLEWVWDEDYFEPRELTSYLLDIFGYLNIASFESTLRDALTFKDPRLLYFAAASLLKNDKKVDSKLLNYIAANSEMRKWLFEKLKSLNKLSLFPKKYKTQAALAESVMVNWLTYPTELGRTPTEIKLMEVISVDTESAEGIVDFYVYAFKSDAFDEGWMAGIAGYFIKKAQPTTEDWHYTFSNFEPWESKTAEDHLFCIIQTVQEGMEYDGGENE